MQVMFYMGMFCCILYVYFCTVLHSTYYTSYIPHTTPDTHIHEQIQLGSNMEGNSCMLWLSVWIKVSNNAMQ